MSSLSLKESPESVAISVPFSRKVVKLTFTHANAADRSINDLRFASAISLIAGHSDLDTSSSTNPLIQNGINMSHKSRTRPPLTKQRADISLLMKDLDAITNENAYSLDRGSDIGDGIVVFLMEIKWWNEWLRSTDDATHWSDSPSNTPRRNVPTTREINNWLLVDELRSQTSVTPLATCHTKLSFEEESDKSIVGRGIETDTYYRNRFHLKNDLLEGDVKIVTFEVWTTLCAWYGGGPPLPATIVLCNDGESGQERESSEVNYIRNRMSTNSGIIDANRSAHFSRNADHRGLRNFRSSEGERHGNGSAKIAEEEKNREREGERRVDSVTLWPMHPLSLEDINSFQQSFPSLPPILSDTIEGTSSSVNCVSDEEEMSEHTTTTFSSVKGPYEKTDPSYFYYQILVEI